MAALAGGQRPVVAGATVAQPARVARRRRHPRGASLAAVGAIVFLQAAVVAKVFGPACVVVPDPVAGTPMIVAG